MGNRSSGGYVRRGSRWSVQDASQKVPLPSRVGHIIRLAMRLDPISFA